MDHRIRYHSQKTAFYAPGFVQFDESSELACVLECKRKDSDNEYDVSMKEIPRKELEVWLNEDEKSEQSPAIKLVVFTYNWNKDPYMVNCKKEDHDMIVDKHDLREVYRFCGSSRDGFSAFPAGSSERPKFGLQVMADYCIAWYYDPERKASRGICWFPPGFKNVFLEMVTELQGTMMREPLFLATAFVVATVSTGWEEAETIFRRLREVEEQTGFSVWSDHYIQKIEGDYGELSADTTGTKARNVQNDHYTQYTFRLIDFITCNSPKGDAQLRVGMQREKVVSHDSEISKTMQAVLEDCEHRMSMLDMFSRTLEKRLDAQLTAVSQLEPIETRTPSNTPADLPSRHQGRHTTNN